MNNMNWLAIVPEIVLLTMACVVALVDLWVERSAAPPTYWLTQLSLGGGRACCTCWPSSAARPSMRCSGMVVADPMGHLLGFFATHRGDDHAGLCAAVRGVARDAQGRVVHAQHVLAARHRRDGVGQQLPGRLPRPRADEPVAVRADRDAARPSAGHRGGDEVFRARRAGQRLPALRPVDDVRRHRLARDRRGLQGDRHRPDQQGGAGLRRRLRRLPAWRSSSARCRSTCGSPTSTRARRPPSRC